MSSKKPGTSFVQHPQPPLNIPPLTPPVSKKAEPVPDSWEDESSDEDEVEAAPAKKETTPSPAKKTIPIEVDLPPFLPTTTSSSPSESRQSGTNDPPERRPIKSTATARRLIAGALGVRSRPTAEEREYEKAIREKEKKRREEEKLKKKEEEAKKGQWGFDE